LLFGRGKIFGKNTFFEKIVEAKMAVWEQNPARIPVMAIVVSVSSFRLMVFSTISAVRDGK
jgi:hypothetical protein